MWTILLLIVSNVFMTIAWYGHLKYTKSPLWIAIIASWAIALAEYCFQVPANRIGAMHGWPGMGIDSFSPTQLKTIQEIVTLTVFPVFSWLYFRQPLHWNHYVGFAFILAAAYFVFGFQTATK
jgi:uncharacterized protein (DUF486 family)